MNSAVSTELRDLITHIVRDYPLWGTERRGEFLKLRIVVSACSIRHRRWSGSCSPPSQTWQAPLASHLGEGLFTVWTLICRPRQLVNVQPPVN